MSNATTHSDFPGPAFAAESYGAAGHQHRSGAAVAQPAEPAAERPSSSPGASALASRRSPWIAAFLSGFPGLGSIYNGSYARGVAFFLTILGLLHLAERGRDLWGFGVAFVWLFNMIDAYREARFIRAGLADDLGARRRPPATSAAEGLGLGAALLLIGLLAFLDATLGLDVDWIFELWPVGMMLAGAWFVWLGVRRLRQPRVTPASAPSPAFEREPDSPRAAESEDRRLDLD